ncbi:MAG: sortase B protein-sorting domain-containing protein [Mesorhizobium sp.]|nr:MAG: sortase B protein-sorting domain-containing protein [Mesorhizobium sp.]
MISWLIILLTISFLYFIWNRRNLS